MLCLGIICLPVFQFLPAVLLAVFPVLIPYHYGSLALPDSRIYHLGLQADSSVNHGLFTSTKPKNIIQDEIINDPKSKRAKIRFNHQYENIDKYPILEKFRINSTNLSDHDLFSSTKHKNIIQDEKIDDSKSKRAKITFNPPYQSINKYIALEKSRINKTKLSVDGDDKPVFSGQSINSGGSLLLLDNIDEGMLDKSSGQGMGKEYVF